MDRNLDVTEPSPAARDFAATLALRGVILKVRNNRLIFEPASAYRELTDDERAILRRYREDIKQIARDGVVVPSAPIGTGQQKSESAATPRQQEVAPSAPIREFRAYGRVITERDVTRAMTAMGDEALADYQSGRITRNEAFAMTARGMRQAMEMKRLRK